MGFYFFAHLEVGKQGLSLLGTLPPPTGAPPGAVWIVHHISCWYWMTLLSQSLMVTKKKMYSLVHPRIYWAQCYREAEPLEMDKKQYLPQLLSWSLESRRSRTKVLIR